MTELFFKGLLVGLIASSPFGAMAVLVIQRTANRDLKSGFYTGLGIAITDTIWALIAGFSVSFVIDFLRENQIIIQIIGGIVLLTLGLHIFRSHPLKAIKRFKQKGSTSLQCMFSSMLIAFSNPLVVLAYIAVFAGINVIFNIHHLWSPTVFSLGFFIGATVWWFILTNLINYFRHHFNLRILWWFNKISGVAIILFVVVSTIIVLIKGSPSI
ncbi:MAG: LysE family transporter [Prolixibacteraceae bacterium]|jgi:threonine/homoserine/homoserine lactone efflux protein|nr:LysE family transporter [Prolixibacteraceae bacterium]